MHTILDVRDMGAKRGGVKEKWGKGEREGKGREGKRRGGGEGKGERGGKGREGRVEERGRIRH